MNLPLWSRPFSDSTREGYTHDSLVFGGCRIVFPLPIIRIPADSVRCGLQHKRADW